MQTNKLSLSVSALALALAACAGQPADDLDPDSDLVLDGKDDRITNKVSIRGAIGFGDQIASTFDATKLHGYTFHAAVGARLDVALSGDDEKTDTVVLVYGPRSGAGWGARIARDDDGGGEHSSYVGDLEIPTTGEYLVVATCKNRTFAGRGYNLSLACTGDHCTAPPPPVLKGTIRVEVDYVGYQRFEPGTVELVEDYFASIGYDLAFIDGDVLEPVDILDYGANSPMLRDYYLDSFEHRGQPGWHYMLMGDTVANGNRGWGLIGGDLFLISSDPVNSYPDHRTEGQAHIVMHELGHNLGLVHEGFEPELAAGTHNKSTCATADRAPAPDVPVTFYSPTCIEHLSLDTSPYVRSDAK